MPGKGCGEPEKEKLHDYLRSLLLDSQWWFQDWDEVEGINQKMRHQRPPGHAPVDGGCFKKYDKERVVLSMHHPLFSNGQHGGNFSWKHHLFPLTMWKKMPGCHCLASAHWQFWDGKWALIGKMHRIFTTNN